MTEQQLIADLNAPKKQTRLDSLKKLMSLYHDGTLKPPQTTESVNNHIHTTYSFSPYSPTKAVYMAFRAGLTTAGIMDHDTIAGAEEFLEAGKIAGIACTVGFEARVKMEGSKFYDRRYNNPDQKSVAYVACHGVPHQNINKVQEFLTPFREKRNIRNRKQVDRINELLAGSGVSLDFDKDVVPISMYKEGGTITERHILYALSLKLIDRFGRGRFLVDFLKDDLKMSISPKLEATLLYDNGEYYAYDLLGALKGNLVEKFFIDADEECPTAKQFIDFVKSIGAISAYAYLGDVGDSVTGDKKAQKFEDDFLDELLPELKEMGFNAITFMPTRNTTLQLARLMLKCKELDFFEICGEDVNSPSQSFVCDELIRNEYRHLISSTWALIGHENAASGDQSYSMFSDSTIEQFPNLKDRIKYFEQLGRI